MAAKKITEQSLAANPEWISSGLKVGDDEPKKEKTKSVVEIDVDTLKDFLEEMKGLKLIAEKVSKLEKDNAMLLEVADKNRLANYQMKNSPTGLVRVARAWVWNGELIKATITLKNSAYTDTLGRVHTDQVLNVIFKDGTQKEVTYDQFMKERTLREGEIVSKTESKGQMFYTLKFKDGEEFIVNGLFVN